MKIEVFYVPNCPNHAIALDRLREILSPEGFEVQVNEVLGSDITMAQALKFPGSPTIRVNGHDVEPRSEHASAFGLACRLYSDGSGVPSEQNLRTAIERAGGLKV